MAFRTMTTWTMTIEMLAVTAGQWRVILLLANDGAAWDNRSKTIRYRH